LQGHDHVLTHRRSPASLRLKRGWGSPWKGKGMSEKQTRARTSPVRLELRADGRPSRIVGHAAVFNEWTTLYKGTNFELREIIRPGAFRNALAEKQDVRALFDHDSAIVLGRTKSGTLVLREDARGLLADIAAPDTQAARDVMALIARGDVSGMSFAFRVRPGGSKHSVRQEGGRDIYEDEITDVDLYDVSVVTYPAYEATDVALRARLIESERGQAERQARLERLQRELAAHGV
jgi:uncharacterized protein